MVRFLKSTFSLFGIWLVVCSWVSHNIPENFEYSVAGEAYSHIRLFMTNPKDRFPQPGILTEVLIKGDELDVNTDSAEDFLASIYTHGFYTTIDFDIWMLYYHYNDADSIVRSNILKSFEPWITMGAPKDERWN